MPDVRHETTVTTVTLAKRLAEHGGACAAHRQTINRWVRKGVLAGGKRVKLEAVRVGRKWVTSEEAYARFQDELTRRAGGDPTPIQTPAGRKRDVERDRAEIEANLA